MITSRQRLSCRPPRFRCRVTAADSSVQSSVCARTATRGGISKWAVHHVVATPGQAARRLPPALPAARASLPTSISAQRASVIVPGGAASMS